VKDQQSQAVTEYEVDQQMGLSVAVAESEPGARRRSKSAAEATAGPGVVEELHELWTVDEVAALLKVSRSWVYEHTRARVSRTDRLPFVKIGKYVRFQPRAVGDFLAKRSRIA
jgi:excisionase family DNA binding protein